MDICLLQSLDKIKKTFCPFAGGRPGGSGDLSLWEFFEFSFGASYSLVYSKAVHNFVRSLVGYSLLTYLLQVLLVCVWTISCTSFFSIIVECIILYGGR